MKKINDYAVERLEKAGVKILEKVLTERGGHLVIADVVICTRGSKSWREERRLTLRSFEQVINYVDDIS